MELLLLAWKFILSDNITIGINKLQRNQRSLFPPLCLLADNDSGSAQLGCFWLLSFPVNIWQTQTSILMGSLWWWHQLPQSTRFHWDPWWMAYPFLQDAPSMVKVESRIFFWARAFCPDSIFPSPPHCASCGVCPVASAVMVCVLSQKNCWYVWFWWDGHGSAECRKVINLVLLFQTKSTTPSRDFMTSPQRCFVPSWQQGSQLPGSAGWSLHRRRMLSVCHTGVCWGSSQVSPFPESPSAWR